MSAAWVAWVAWLISATSMIGGVVLFGVYATGGPADVWAAHDGVALFILAPIAMDVGLLVQRLYGADSSTSPIAAPGNERRTERHEGTVRRFGREFNGPDGAGPCVAAIALFRADSPDSFAVPFILEGANGSFVVGSGNWSGMHVANISLRPACRVRWLRRVRGMPEPLPGSNRCGWLCLRDGDAVVLWCNLSALQPMPDDVARPDDEDDRHPYRGRPLGQREVLPPPGDDDEVTNQIGIGTLDAQRRQWWWQWHVTRIWIVLVVPCLAGLLWFAFHLRSGA